MINHVTNVHASQRARLITSHVNTYFCRRPLQNSPHQCCISFLYHVRIKILLLYRDLSRLTHGVVGQMRILIDSCLQSWINTSQSALQHHALLAIHHGKENIFDSRHDKTNKVSVRPAKTQTSLAIHPVWSESSLSAERKLGSLATHWAQAKTDQTGRMPRLICLRWAHAHFIGFVMSRLIS